MEIPIFTIIGFAALYFLLCQLFYIFYRFYLHPNLRWHQEGNIVHSKAKWFYHQYAIIVFIIIQVFIHVDIKFVPK